MAAKQARSRSDTGGTRSSRPRRNAPKVAPSASRRSQAERRATTRLKLIDAVISCIKDYGYAGTRTRLISRKAGVTWGAVQHLFGGKNDLLMHVALKVTDDLLRQLRATAVTSRAIQERLRLAVELTWSLYSSPAYFAMVEIVRGTRQDRAFHERLVEAQSRVHNEVEQLWVEMFKDSKVSEARILKTCNLVVLTLSGLASRKIYLRLRADPGDMLEFLHKVAAGALHRE